MKINSISTQDLDHEGRVIAVSVTKFKVKPEHDGSSDLFFHYKVNDTIERHRSVSKEAKRFVITVSTSRGKFIRTYAAL